MTRHPTLPSAYPGHRPIHSSRAPLSSTRTLPRPLHPLPSPFVSTYLPTYLCPFSLSIVPCAARSLGVAAAFSNSRCNIQQLLAIVCGGWVRSSPPKKELHMTRASNRQIGAAVHQPLREWNRPLSPVFLLVPPFFLSVFYLSPLLPSTTRVSRPLCF